jgi:hypothetical protein
MIYNINIDITFSENVSGITFIRYIAQIRTIGKPNKLNNFKNFGSNKSKGPQQESQNWLTSPMSKAP